MRDTRHSQFPRSARICLSLIFLGLWGCSSTPVESPSEHPPTPVVEQKPPVQQQQSLELPASIYGAQFQAADQALGQNKWMAASDILATIPTQGLNTNDSIYLGYQRARIAYIRGLQAQALQLLANLESPDMNGALRYRILNFRRYIEEMSGAYLASAQLGDELLRFAPEQDAPALKRGIWRNLQRLDTDQLQQAAVAAAANPQWQDWLELALLTRAPLADMLRSLPLWLQNNSQHPAANPLPGGLAYLLKQPPTAEKVALILPLSGRLAPAGRAVRDGYLASYYAARGTTATQNDILVLDGDNYPSTGEAYDTAVAQGASIVVGPLSKQAVAELGSRVDRPIPVLALNRLDEGETLPPGSSAMVQLALAPEDEARTIAGLAYGKGARSALIIRPQGDWGSKVAQALIERWQQLGGSIANSVTYNGREDYSASVKQALDIPASEQRAQELRTIMGSAIEFNSRRRQDVDVIFLLSGNGVEARSLKPLLAFHYAGALPVYATSSIYNGVRDPRDRDLDGINLVEMPWLLGADPELRGAIAAGNTASDNYTRLNALGADAFLVQSRFRQLQAGADALLLGTTGLLSMNPQLHIQRELELATFDEGAIKPQ